MSVLYAARSDIAGDLYALDPDTGAETAIGPIGYAIAALARSDTPGKLWGITTWDDPTALEPSLVEIDIATGAGTLIGACGINSGGNSPGVMDAELVDGVLYVISNGGTSPYYSLLYLSTIDLTTGAATDEPGVGPPYGQIAVNDQAMGFCKDGAGGFWRSSYPQSFGAMSTLDTLSADGSTNTPQGSFYDWVLDGDRINFFLAFARADATTIYALVNTDIDYQDTSEGPFTAELVVVDITDPTSPTTSIKGPVLTGLRSLVWVDGPAPPFVRHAVVVKIYDLASAELADISGICLERTWKPRHNAASSLVVTCPAGSPLLTATADDGYRVLRKGNRKLLAWEDGVIFFHGRIDGVERVGDGTKNRVTITAWDSWMELGYDADGRAGRPVRGSTTQPTAGDPFGEYDGNFIDPLFASSVGGQDEISGPDLIYQALTNSVTADPTMGEGPLPIHVDVANFDLDVPPAIDLTPSDSMSWPLLIGDFVKQLVDTGVVDVRMRPIDPAESLDPYEMNEIFAASLIGTDRSATVHFDYWTGDHNAIACRHVEAFFAEINNKLFDYLGPRIDTEHWRANIAPDSPGVTVDPTASRARYGGPGETAGQFMSIRVFDSIGDESSSRPLYLALYNAELGYRVEPRDMLFITPNPDAKALFEPPADYDRGDLVAINTGGDFGIELAEAQRVYGFDKTWDREGIARVGQLLTSADIGA